MPIARLAPDSHAHAGPVNYLLLGALSADQDIPPSSSAAAIEVDGARVGSRN